MRKCFLKNSGFLALLGVFALGACSTSKHSRHKTVSVSPMIPEEQAGLLPDLTSETAELKTETVEAPLSRPFYRDEVLLNGYYLVEENTDSWEKLSEKLYGNSTQANALKNLNFGTRLERGQVVYFNSPFRPLDQDKMMFYSKEYQVSKDKELLAQLKINTSESRNPSQALNNLDNEHSQLSHYTVKKGDSLWKISKNLFNDGTQWKELFAENKDLLANPNLLKEGTNLKLPSTITSKSMKSEPVMAEAHHQVSVEIKPTVTYNLTPAEAKTSTSALKEDKEKSLTKNSQLEAKVDHQDKRETPQVKIEALKPTKKKAKNKEPASIGTNMVQPATLLIKEESLHNEKDRAPAQADRQQKKQSGLFSPRKSALYFFLATGIISGLLFGMMMFRTKDY